MVNKHLMTGPKGNSEFCFPETSLRFEGNDPFITRNESANDPISPVIFTYKRCRNLQ